ncbi:Longitudinals lacking protein, isoform G [Zootermopsis nevadensis]|uniref:Longitudinals lacking protein, isoform G n=1 Tax=Zootermopsis nevadensis TaxID=136037 RepID=A0A067RDG9_ZOONE|nr:Longitudinals lacking protein, isoform G [Zootermopsis nevadensis]
MMPSVSSQNNSTTDSPPLNSPSGYTNISSAGQSTTMRFDRHVLPNYSSSFMSSLTPTSHNSSTMFRRQFGDIPTLPTQLLFCKKCGRSYAWEYTLKRHIRLECGKEATLQCPLCPRRTKHKHSLLRHINKFHPDAHV